jgi:hypothetical protein
MRFSYRRLNVVSSRRGPIAIESAEARRPLRLRISAQLVTSATIH